VLPIIPIIMKILVKIEVKQLLKSVKGKLDTPCHGLWCRSAGRRSGRSPDEHEDKDLFQTYRQEDRVSPSNI